MEYIKEKNNNVVKLKKFVNAMSALGSSETI